MRCFAQLRMLPAFALAIGLGLLVQTAPADTLYDTTFAGPDGTIPPNWVVIDGTPAGWGLDSGDYRFDGSGNEASTLEDTFVLNDGTAAEDLRHTVINTAFRKSAGGNITGTVSHRGGGAFYHARLRGDSALELYAFNGGVTQLGSTVTTSQTYSSGDTWRLVMTTLGGKDAQQVGALLYNNTGQIVGQIRETTTNVLVDGSPGVRGSNPSAWEDFRVSSPLQITTADGDGADAFVESRTDQNVEDSNFGTTATAQAKSGVTGSDEIYRKAYLRFDLGNVQPQNIFSAAIDLNVNSRNSSSTTFNIYGLLDSVAGDDDPSGTGWIESGTGGITWNNAPANGSQQGITSDATLLGTFTGGTNDELLGFTSEALVDFLNSDTNGLVTFIITMPTAGGFADGDFLQVDTYNSTGIAPTLNLVAIPEPSSLMLMVGLLFGFVRRQPATAKTH